MLARRHILVVPADQSPDILTTAVQFHTVEAEHATGWRFLAGENPVPFDFASPRTKPEVLAIVAPILNVGTSSGTAGGSSGTPSTMPNTGSSTDSSMKVIGAVGGIAAVAAGAALMCSQRGNAAEHE